MGDYDKIIKENIESVFLALAEKLLGLRIKTQFDLPEKIQTTVEREPDFLKKVILHDGSQSILHLEFQLADEPKMVYRMAEYKALLQRKYEIPVNQFVIYLGTNPPSMPTQLSPEEQITGFQLRDIHQMPVSQTLNSQIPEEIILSILTDYPRVDSEKVIAQIIQKLKSLSPNPAELKRSLQQLITLSRIRKLEELTEKQVSDMPIAYDIETDYLYNKGIQKGMEKGIRLTILEMAADPSMSLEKIAKFTKTTVDYVKRVISESK